MQLTCWAFDATTFMASLISTLWAFLYAAVALIDARKIVLSTVFGIATYIRVIYSEWTKWQKKTCDFKFSFNQSWIALIESNYQMLTIICTNICVTIVRTTKFYTTLVSFGEILNATCWPKVGFIIIVHVSITWISIGIWPSKVMTHTKIVTHFVSNRL